MAGRKKTTTEPAAEAQEKHIHTPLGDVDLKTDGKSGEVGFLGMKFKLSPTVAAILFTVLSALGGGAWTVTQMYADFRHMQEQINGYVAPDFAPIEKQLATMSERVKTVEERVETAREAARDARNSAKGDLNDVYSRVDSVDKANRDLRKDMVDSERRTSEAVDRKLEKMRKEMANPLVD